jgi:hypothetical protein
MEIMRQFQLVMAAFALTTPGKGRGNFRGFTGHIDFEAPHLYSASHRSERRFKNAFGNAFFDGTEVF